MSKMHELLAVEASVIANYQRDLDETLKVLERADLFTQTVTKKEHFNEDDKKLDTTETKAMTTTVKNRLKWFKNSASKFYDVVLQKDTTNQNSKADLEVDGNVLAKDVPATTLLMFESKLQDLRKVFDKAPTLAAGTTWKLNPQDNLFHSEEPQVSFSTKKLMKPVVLYEATKEHPAQVKEVTEDVAIAKISRTVASGMITSAEKAEILGRLDTLIQATKKARQRANQVEVVNGNIGDSIFKYLFGDTIK